MKIVGFKDHNKPIDQLLNKIKQLDEILKGNRIIFVIFVFKRKQVKYFKREIWAILKEIEDYDSIVPIFSQPYSYEIPTLG